MFQKCADYKASEIPTFARTDHPNTQVPDIAREMSAKTTTTTFLWPKKQNKTDDFSFLDHEIDHSSAEVLQLEEIQHNHRRTVQTGRGVSEGTSDHRQFHVEPLQDDRRSGHMLFKAKSVLQYRTLVLVGTRNHDQHQKYDSTSITIHVLMNLSVVLTVATIRLGLSFFFSIRISGRFEIVSRHDEHDASLTIIRQWRLHGYLR